MLVIEERQVSGGKARKISGQKGCFTGADQPYDKLKRALRADIDEAAWSALYSTTSRPFPKPATGKIAIKVINHYGDEVLKIFEI